MVRTLGTLALAGVVGAFSAGNAYAQSTSPQEPTQPTQSTQPTQQGAPQGRADEAAVRQALLDARESLATLSKSPEAAQLQGQARTEVSQLISNFNALLSAESNWYEQYQTVMQNLHNLIGPVESSSGSTGTSGTAAGSASTGVEVPAALRDQLVDFRERVMEFGRAAGAPDVTGGVTSSGSAATATSGTTATGSGAATPAAAETIEQHIDAINDIIQEAMSGQPSTGSASAPPAGSTTGTAGTTGSSAASSPAAGTVTIDRAKLDKIQSHLQRMREIARTKGIK